ncbi:MAG: DUF4331 domain-containing protein [Acidimicrobiales bacterium]
MAATGNADLANYIPLEAAAGGPNFYQFGDDVLYEIHISNDGKAGDNIVYRFQFQTAAPNPAAGFLYNTGPITSLDAPTWNRKQTYSVSKVVNGGAPLSLGTGLGCPPCNIGPLSTPNYSALADAAVHSLPGGVKVFAGQRAEGFYVDLGAVFDLADLRPFANLHAGGPLSMGSGVNALATANVHTIAIQVPKTMLTVDGSNPTDPMAAKSVIGVYASASRPAARMYSPAGAYTVSGGFVQVSRLGMPLFNELLVPLGDKDTWNASAPSGDSRFAGGVSKPVLGTLLPQLYPGVFPNLDAFNKTGMPRADLLAIFLTGIPSGIIPSFQNNTGTTQADLLRLNMAIPPTASPNVLGLLGNDPAGFPNGRRVIDDITTVELRALAGVTLQLVTKALNPKSFFTADAAAAKVTDDVSDAGLGFLNNFPYLALPHSGYDTPSPASASGGSPPASANPPASQANPSSSAAGTATSGAPVPRGAPATGGGGAEGLNHRLPLAADAVAVAAVGAATAVTAARRLPAKQRLDDSEEGPE